jgi:hypothetical protein
MGHPGRYCAVLSEPFWDSGFELHIVWKSAHGAQNIETMRSSKMGIE